MRDILKEFRDYQLEAGMPYDSSFVPRHYDDIRDLEHGYAQNEMLAEAREAKAQAQLDAMRTKELPTLSENVVTQDELTTALADGFKFIGEEYRKLEKRLAALETPREGAMLWRSAWREGESYCPGDVVQHGGALYVCKATATQAKPGVGTGWQLMVKRVA